MMLSRGKVHDLEQLIVQLRNGSGPQGPARPAERRPAPAGAPMVLAMHMAGARDLVFEKVSDDEAAHPGAVAEKAAYVVTKAGGADNRVVAELTLKHQ